MRTPVPADPITIETQQESTNAPTPPNEGVYEKLQRLMADGPALIATDSDWKEAYKDSSPDVLKQEVDRIESLIFEATRDEMEYRFAINMGVETLSYGSTYKSRDFDPTSVYWVRVPPGGPVQRVTLPREEFPEIYELKALSAWLRDALAQHGVAYTFSIE